MNVISSCLDIPRPENTSGCISSPPKHCEIDEGLTTMSASLSPRDRRDSSCHTSECSFEMNSEDERENTKLCSIDELFASPPSAHKPEREHEDDVKVNDESCTDPPNQPFQTSPIKSAPTPLNELFQTLPIKSALVEQVADQDIIANTSLDPSLCWSCHKESPKYKCPQCSRRTCSLPCVKYHKEKLKCNGERIKTDYVGKQDFTESHFLSDYRFLEEINRCVTQRHHFPRSHFKNKTMKLLTGKAYSMNIHLKLLPSSFKRRKENSTYYCFKNREFLWHVEWIFDSCSITICERRLSDSTPLRKGIDKFITASKDNEQFDPRLHDYSSKEEINFYMKKEKTPANETIYYKLDASKSLRSNLEKKIIVEFPRIYVVLADRAQKFEQSLCEET